MPIKIEFPSIRPSFLRTSLESLQPKETRSLRKTRSTNSLIHSKLINNPLDPGNHLQAAAERLNRDLLKLKNIVRNHKVSVNQFQSPTARKTRTRQRWELYCSRRSLYVLYTFYPPFGAHQHAVIVSPPWLVVLLFGNSLSGNRTRLLLPHPDLRKEKYLQHTQVVCNKRQSSRAGDEGERGSVDLELSSWGLRSEEYETEMVWHIYKENFCLSVCLSSFPPKSPEDHQYQSLSLARFFFFFLCCCTRSNDKLCSSSWNDQVVVAEEEENKYF